MRNKYEIATSIVSRLGNKVAPQGTLDDGQGELDFVARVLQEEGCTPQVFQMLDEGPGHFAWGGYDGLNGEWHYRLRRFRNRAPRSVFCASVSTPNN